jgi:hypothetical protein
VQECRAQAVRSVYKRIRSFAEGEPSRLARRVLFAFVLTFIVSRAVVLLIMSRKIPLMFLNVRGNHVHHLNYGILLLTVTGAYLLFAKPHLVAARRVALVYGVGLALTFDEFGMWLHLGGSYWQRASVDAVIVIASFLALLGVAPPLEHMRPKHRLALFALLLAIVGFGTVLVIAGKEVGKIEGPKLRELEMSSTP